ncbi:MAG: bifunctional aspartate kinase/homoserine dehydrogenase I, partial [Treponema sp.]|nr:bifunctional aspartate kinase/homoserine dehydrogenase I [Treponema sp.]
MLVLKFGGSSVGSPEAIENVIAIIKAVRLREKSVLVVVSALSGVTDALIEMGRQAAAGDVSYQQAAQALKTRHLDIAAHFLSGQDLAQQAESIEARISDLLRALDGVSVLRESSPRSRDLAMCFGELLSASLVADICSSRGIMASFVDSRDLIKTDGEFGKAAALEEQTFSLIRAWFDSQPGFKNARELPVAAGFIGSAPDGSSSTLGRGGSDLSAAIFAAALGAREIEIWTDVDGILTADPRRVKNAFPIKSISYEEATELSHFGAKVIYPPSIRPALEKGIPIRIKNTFNPDSEGTRIVKEAVPGAYPIRGISSMGPVALVRVQGPAMAGVPGFSSRLFGALAKRGISVILITQSSSEYSICFAVLPADVPGAEEAVREEFAGEIGRGAIDPPITEGDLSIIAAVGSLMKSTPGISGKVFHALGRNGVNVVAIAQGSCEINISAVIQAQDESKALNAVHEAFFLSGERSVNLFLIGTGHIGGTLLEQIANQRETLAESHKIRINLAGAADSKNMMFDPQGIDPRTAAAALKSGAPGIQPFSLPAFIAMMKSLNLPNAAFCDCTANDDVAGIYGEALKAAIPVITPNKRAGSASYERYQALKDISRERGIPYLYETTVCAGLPVISTLRDLTLAGDRVRRIEAVLSGTLSFIFNSFDGKKSFSALVRDAKAKGYTEPDPRDDLNAKDAARKALILARECGMALELSSVAIEPILPEACFQAADVDAFFAELEKADGDFEARRVAAAARGRELRYVAVIEDGCARLSLREEESGSPFLSLVDSDNIVVI